VLAPHSGVVLMGGSTMPLPDGLPQWGPEMDWNINIDPAAARRVLERCDPIVVMHNVTLQVHLRGVDLPRLRVARGLAELIARQAEARQPLRDLRPLARHHARLPKDLLNFLHDSLTSATALGWDGVTIERVPLHMDEELVEQPKWSAALSARGLVLRRGERGAAADVSLRIVSAVDAETFRNMWLDTVAPSAPVTR
jgi:inosine-uridine nucleoside N-ribohydrolase